MDYSKHYNSLIKKARSRTLTGYFETHHIIPKCIGGSDEKSNLVELTPEEHYIAHQLLIKIYPNEPKLLRAAMMMIPNRPSNKLYGWLRRKFSKVVSEQQTGEGNSQFGTRWIHHKELKQSKKINKDAPLPDGWIEGRIIKFDKPIKWTKTYIKNKEMKDHTLLHYQQFLSSECKSLNEYCKLYYEYSLVTFTKRLQKFVPEYNDVSSQGVRDIKSKLMGVKL